MKKHKEIKIFTALTNNQSPVLFKVKRLVKLAASPRPGRSQHRLSHLSLYFFFFSTLAKNSAWSSNLKVSRSPCSSFHPGQTKTCS